MWLQAGRNSFPYHKLRDRSRMIMISRPFCWWPVSNINEWFRPLLYANCSIDGWTKHLLVVSSLDALKILLPLTDRLLSCYRFGSLHGSQTCRASHRFFSFLVSWSRGSVCTSEISTWKPRCLSSVKWGNCSDPFIYIYIFWFQGR